MTAQQLRAILDWRMCSDPWPGGDMDSVDDWLDGVCREGGYQNWVEAYHSLVGAPEIFPGTLDALRRLGANVEGNRRPATTDFQEGDKA